MAYFCPIAEWWFYTQILDSIKSTLMPFSSSSDAGDEYEQDTRQEALQSLSHPSLTLQQAQLLSNYWFCWTKTFFLREIWWKPWKSEAVAEPWTGLTFLKDCSKAQIWAAAIWNLPFQISFSERLFPKPNIRFYWKTTKQGSFKQALLKIQHFYLYKFVFVFVYVLLFPLFLDNQTVFSQLSMTCFARGLYLCFCVFVFLCFYSSRWLENSRIIRRFQE